ncbi:helix-turn-helix transcriptional regulator [Sphingorhabdus contaminans]|uniref:Helix-turn-helix transcriptional regulator n=1 Tax=Sphingorhabdus contaminans TaxID=1343899 RepID=A0A553WA77_9SPHN|nr:helix-turn-helix transcriptional regulator [Sphingorhabdus contaminans]
MAVKARTPGGLEELTERQIDVLVRVAQLKSSKQIARELGISHHTVDQRLRTIIEKLGVESRADAARAYVAFLGRNPLDEKLIYEDTAYQFPHLVDGAILSEQEPSAGEWNPAADGTGQRLQEVQAHYFAGDVSAPPARSVFSVLLEADRKNRLTVWGRALCILATMFLTLLVMGALVGLAEGLSRLF